MFRLSSSLISKFIYMLICFSIESPVQKAGYTNYDCLFRQSLNAQTEEETLANILIACKKTALDPLDHFCQ